MFVLVKKMGTPTVIVKEYRVRDEEEQAEIMPQVMDYFERTFYRFGKGDPFKMWSDDRLRFKYHGREYFVDFEESSKKVEVAQGLEMIVGEVKIRIRFPLSPNKSNARLMRRIDREVNLPFKPIDDF